MKFAIRTMRVDESSLMVQLPSGYSCRPTWSGRETTYAHVSFAYNECSFLHLVRHYSLPSRF